MYFYEIIKRTRKELHFSQEQLSRELSISFTTVNSWKNGRSLPSHFAKNALIECCTTKNISEDILKALKRPEIYQMKKDTE
jgi:transcriptional regulator with XRE-family HTH domain